MHKIFLFSLTLVLCSPAFAKWSDLETKTHIDALNLWGTSMKAQGMAQYQGAQCLYVGQASAQLEQLKVEFTALQKSHQIDYYPNSYLDYSVALSSLTSDCEADRPVNDQLRISYTAQLAKAADEMVKQLVAKFGPI